MPARKRGLSYMVREVSAQRALRFYVCPGCANEIQPGVAHIVAWRSDSIMGDTAALAERRHWHKRCWQIH